ncbi:ABC transporter substrate-binding protein [Methylopila turkensis]|uniref:ABC transporter substrate-binding protein n=1 Tax=Methylopila turkensis TaxID=1437816 RepID=A0A9W6JQZ0_9HYPH|nr:ABC transporter substrate-binding protein [Methylopila turkensis]GLK81682.1 ABC transporter substrate-binding protein [Methylopila turkensis]
MIIGRGVAALMAALALGLAALAATAPDADDRPKGVLVVGQTGEPRSLDPSTVTASNDFRIISSVFEGLTRFRKGSLAVEPALAERWEISDGGLSYTFHLRPGARFHDGEPVDADAVVYTFGRMLDPKHPQAEAGPFPLAFFFAAVKAVEAVDPLTVRFRLERPYAPLLSNLAYPAGFIVSPAAARAAGRGFGRAPVGSGPFRFVRWESGRQVELARNDAYWGGPPKLDGIVFRPIADGDARAAEMLAGGLDLMLELPPDAAPRLSDPERFRTHGVAGPHLWYLALNARRGPLADVRVRRAVNYAIDKRAITDSLLRGTADAPAGVIPAAFGPASDPELKPYPHDPDHARALLKQAGAEGARLRLLASEGGSGMLEPIAMAVAIQADLARVGLRVEIETFEWNAYLARVNAGLGDADMAEMAWMTNDPDTLPYLALRGDAGPGKGGFNAGGYANDELDRLLDQARAEIDADRRAALYRRIDRLVHDDAPFAFVASWRQNAVTAARVRGFALEPSFLLDLRGVDKR